MSAMLCSLAKRSAPVAGAVALAAVAIIGLGQVATAGEAAVKIPAPAVDETAKSGMETAIFAGGCFWGVQGVFEHVAGVESAISGYAGGTVVNPTYQQVSSETTGHAESVKVTFDRSKVTYGKLMQIFFSVTADPTTLNYQGPDHGTSYRSALFTMSDEQAKVANAYIAQLDAAHVFRAKIVTEVTPYTNFYQAEDYHQDNAITLKVNRPYLEFYDLPKIANLKAMFPKYWRAQPALVFARNAQG